MKKNIKSFQGLFLLLLCATFLVSFSSGIDEPLPFKDKATPQNLIMDDLLLRTKVIGSVSCPECVAAFKACSAVPEKKFTDEVSKTSADFKSGKIKRKEIIQIFEAAKGTFMKETSLCSVTFEKCCLDEMRKAKETKKVKGN